MLDPLRLDLVEVVDRLPELVDRLVEDVRRIDPRLLLRLRLPQLLELRGGVVTYRARHGELNERERCQRQSSVLGPRSSDLGPRIRLLARRLIRRSED